MGHTSLAKRTMPPTPFERVFSTAMRNMMKSVNHRIRNKIDILVWKRRGGPGYGIWSILNENILRRNSGSETSYIPIQFDRLQANGTT